MPLHAMTSAEISLPSRPDPGRLSRRIALLAKHVDLVTLTDNHAGQARMSPLAAVALAREQGVRTVVHVSARDRNRLALQSEVVGAAALGCDGIVCLHGDNSTGITRVGDLSGTGLLAVSASWIAPLDVPRGCVVNPFASDMERELALLRRKVMAGARFTHTQMSFDIPRLCEFLDRAQSAGLTQNLRIFASIAVLRNRKMADRARSLAGCAIPDEAYRQISGGRGVQLALELAERIAGTESVQALHVMPLGDEETASQVAIAYRRARGILPIP